MRTNIKIDDFFIKNPDAATLAKIDIFKKYFAIYFRLIEMIRQNPVYNAGNKEIKYIDLFSGPGFFVSNEKFQPSTPLIVLDNVLNKGYSNIKFYFNDRNANAICFLKEAISKRYGNKFECDFQSVDARKYDLNAVISSNDIVISLIDSYSYLGLDKNTIFKLTKNFLSDVVCYFRVANILEHIGNESEKNNHIEILGDEENYQSLLQMCKSNVPQIDKVNFLIKSWITNLNSIGNEKFFLPIFINYSGENTKIESVVFIISKNLLGLNRLLSMLSDVENCDGRLFSYIGADLNRLTFFDFETGFIEEVIKENDDYITRSILLEQLNAKFIKKYGYISAYNEAHLNKKLKALEENGILDIYYVGNGTRRNYTYADKTKFRLK